MIAALRTSCVESPPAQEQAFAVQLLGLCVEESSVRVELTLARSG